MDTAADEHRTCKRCGDEVAYLSTDDLCDGCVAEEEEGVRHSIKEG